LIVGTGSDMSTTFQLHFDPSQPHQLRGIEGGAAKKI
jgi:hypothetical protein